VLQLHLHETAKASLLTSDMEHSTQKNATGQEYQSLRFCIFQMVPWYFRLLYHTMHFRVDDQVRLVPVVFFMLQQAWHRFALTVSSLLQQNKYLGTVVTRSDNQTAPCTTVVCSSAAPQQLML